MKLVLSLLGKAWLGIRLHVVSLSRVAISIASIPFLTVALLLHGVTFIFVVVRVASFRFWIGVHDTKCPAKAQQPSAHVLSLQHHRHQGRRNPQLQRIALESE